MAHTRAGGAFRVTATEDIEGIRKIRRVIVDPTGAATVTIRSKDAAGSIVYEYTGSTRVDEAPWAELSEGARVEVANAVVFVYTG